MISRVNKLLVALAIIALTSYIFYLNPHSITVNLGGADSWTAPLAVVLLTVFASGVLATALVSLFFGMKAYLRERGFASREHKWQLIREKMLEARGLTAAEEWGEARNRWQDILKRDPANTIARVELSRALERAGELPEAQRVLDDARAAGEAQLEILLRAAELALSQGNRTAALDNLTLSLKRQPSLRAARLARSLALQLQRYDEALEFHRQLVRMGGTDESVAEIEFARLLSRAKPEELTSRLREFVRHEVHAPALIELAAREAAEGHREDAAKLYLRAADVQQDPSIALKGAEQLVASHLPDRAVTQLRAFVGRLDGKPKLLGELAYAQLAIQLQMSTDAQRSLDTIGEMIATQPDLLTPEVQQRLTIISGLLAASGGDAAQSLAQWKRLAGLPITDERPRATFTSNGSALHTPSPTLSTP